jgi:hypothetical protein
MSALTLPADKQDALLRQLEYYLSDVSLPFDTFLAEEMKRDDSDSTVSIAAETLAGFPRVAQLCAGLSESERAAELRLAAAKSDSVRACDDGRIGRRYPLPADDAAADRTVYLTNFPPSTSEETVKSAVGEWANGAVPERVRLLRDLKDRSLSGSCHVRFADAAAAAALLAAAAGTGLQGPNGRKVQAKLLRAHYEAEAAEAAERQKRMEAKAAKKKEAETSAAAEALRHGIAASVFLFLFPQLVYLNPTNLPLPPHPADPQLTLPHPFPQ